MMLKRLDRLILKSFLPPFFLTFFVVVFIFLIQTLIKYFPELVGKGIDNQVFAQLFFYFAINVMPVSLPLAVLLSSLICFGNLGEHFELTAIKSSGISLLRVLMPIFIFTLLLCVLAFYVNNEVVPKANLKAFSLLYDIRQKKPSLDLKEGSFYNGIPGYSIRVDKKDPKTGGLKNVIIYNHTKEQGNTEVVYADSGNMYVAYGDAYLVLDLYKGHSFSEVQKENQKKHEFFRNEFEHSQVVFSLSSFDLSRTNEELFANHRIMLNTTALKEGKDSLHKERDTLLVHLGRNSYPYFQYFFRPNASLNVSKAGLATSRPLNQEQKRLMFQYAANQARSVKSYTQSFKTRIDQLNDEANSYEIERLKKFTQSFACLVMFLIGAPLGAIIKKGGLGLPVLISIIFFVIYYIISIMTEKWAKEGVVDMVIGMWSADLFYLPIGLFFLRQAKNDSNILDLQILEGIRKFFAKFLKKA